MISQSKHQIQQLATVGWSWQYFGRDGHEKGTAVNHIPPFFQATGF